MSAYHMVNSELVWVESQFGVQASGSVFPLDRIWRYSNVIPIHISILLPKCILPAKALFKVTLHSIHYCVTIC